jgi:hypothetical protein
VNLSIPGFVPFSTIDPGGLFAAPLQGEMRLCLRAYLDEPGRPEPRLLVIRPSLEDDGQPRIIDPGSYDVRGGIPVHDAVIAPDLSTADESLVYEPGHLFVAEAIGYIIVRRRHEPTAVRLSDGLIGVERIPLPKIGFAKWSVVRQTPQGIKPLFDQATGKLFLGSFPPSAGL